MQFALFFFALASILAHFSAVAAPISNVSVKEPIVVEERQIGDVACNVARAKTVAGLAASSLAVDNVRVMAANNASAMSALSAATNGLNSAKAGVAVIAGELLTLQTASVAARTQVQNGLDAAKTALASINSTTNAMMMNAVAAASTMVDNTITAGQEVVSNC
ncbi:hypothetical protein H0H92_008603 [Tricholoma furcatifolium]|nr:hypothetical protein H0H92_008603 [Tricholoma furcatifolium]